MYPRHARPGARRSPGAVRAPRRCRTGPPQGGPFPWRSSFQFCESQAREGEMGKARKLPIRDRIIAHFEKRRARGDSPQALAEYLSAAFAQFGLGDPNGLPLQLPVRVAISRKRIESQARRRESEEKRLARVLPPGPPTVERKSLTAGLSTMAVREALGCTLAELNRWAADGRLPPDGEKHFRIHRSTWGRAWLPERIAKAKLLVEAWRQQDITKASYARRGLKAVPAPAIASRQGSAG